jgi:hypothetical protein
VDREGNPKLPVLAGSSKVYRVFDKLAEVAHRVT